MGTIDLLAVLVLGMELDFVVLHTVVVQVVLDSLFVKLVVVVLVEPVVQDCNRLAHRIFLLRSQY